MSFTAIINSIALSPDAYRVSSGNRPYGERAWLMRNVILPWYRSLRLFDDIVVVGEFEEGPGYRYIHCPQVHHNVGDALIQRTVGFDATTGIDGDWVLFQHDDHRWEPENPIPLAQGGFDNVLSPARYTRARFALGEPLNDGHWDGYVNGHACLMRRWVAQKVPWSSAAPVFTWDVEYTKALASAGIAWRYAPEYAIWDMELGATPWA